MNAPSTERRRKKEAELPFPRLHPSERFFTPPARFKWTCCLVAARHDRVIACQSAVLHPDLTGTYEVQLLVDDANVHAKCESVLQSQSAVVYDQNLHPHTCFPVYYLLIYYSGLFKNLEYIRNDGLHPKAALYAGEATVSVQKGRSFGRSAALGLDALSPRS